MGSTVGMSALGLKPIVEVQFADYIYPALNQLITEISKSCYLSNGKFPIQMLLRIPIGALALQQGWGLKMRLSLILSYRRHYLDNIL